MRRVLATMLWLLPVATLAAPPPRLVVMELRAGQGLEEKAAASLTAMLAGDAARVGFGVVAQSDVAAMLSFQKQRQMLGCSDDGCLAELGGALGADYVLTGEVAQIGTRSHQSLTLLDARSGLVVSRLAGFAEGEGDAMALTLLARFREVARRARPELLASAPPIDPPGAVRLRARRRASYWTLGAGGALLAGGAVVGLLARSQAGALKGDWREVDYRARYDRQRRTALAADLLLATGALTTSAGAYLYWTSRVPVVAVPVATRGGFGLAVAGAF